MSEKIDEKDLMILDVLEKHGEYTVRKIAKKTLLAPTTVHARIKKLKKMKVIRKFTIDIDRKKIGLMVGAYILVSADLKHLKQNHKSQYDLAKEIEKLPGVRTVHIVTGVSDLVARVRFKDIEEFDKFLLSKLQMLEGVSKTQTMIIMH
jgi:DNA-binding Lrp family transcriptional regulator